MKFMIECEMRDRWVNSFLSMLKAMEYNGAIGHTGKISIIADGDGDFNPKFVFDENLPHDDIPLKSTKEEIIFDAG